jgi:asparagine synthase (glutamine-hydrolysing)
MCGIAGVVALQEGASGPDRELLARMARAMLHRGPDEIGIYRDPRAGLAHARLSIIDLASGQQPMSNEDGALWVAFNGEIFNYLELREELLAHGHVFRTKSDTEVIVHAYEQWGQAAFGRFNGQWAVALWNRTTRELVLSRDPYGKRPLHYTECAGRVLFASEIKSIFCAPEVPRAIDPVGIDQTFTFWASVAPRTPFRGIHEVLPGHTRTYRANGKIEEAPHYVPSYEKRPIARTSDAIDAVRDALERAVSLRMLRADVPVGCYLSGGLDSSLVTALGRKAMGQRFKTFSLRFEDAEFDETPYQRKVVEHLGTEHHEVIVSKQQIAAVFPEVIYHAERPILRTAPAPMFLLSRLVRERGIKVVLTGEGADEMFAGYDLFREGKVRRFWAKHPESKLRPRLLDRLYPYLARSPVRQQAMARQFFGKELAHAHEPGFAHRTRWSTASALKRILSADMRSAVQGLSAEQELLSQLPEAFERWSALAQDQYLETRTLMSPYLLSSQGDRMLMANSIEGRFPFLDRDLMALAGSLPDHVKLQGLDEKHVLKRLGRELLPREVLDRPKQPYRAPDAPSFFGDHEPEWLSAVTTEQALQNAGIFEPKAALALLAKCRSKASDQPFSNTDNMAIVGVLSAQLLHHQLIEKPRVSDVVSEIRTLVEFT